MSPGMVVLVLSIVGLFVLYGAAALFLLRGINVNTSKTVDRLDEHKQVAQNLAKEAGKKKEG